MVHGFQNKHVDAHQCTSIVYLILGLIPSKYIYINTNCCTFIASMLYCGLWITVRHCKSSVMYWGCHNYRTEVEEYKSTVVHRILLFHNSCFLRTLRKKLTLNLLLTFWSFYNSCLCSIISVFLIFLTFTNSVL